MFRSRNVSVPVSAYDARVHGALHVARELDVDAQGRTLVGVESGPHKELRVALDRMRAAPRYGALGMADELILLTADAVAFRDDALAAKAPDGAARFLILNESYHRAVAAHGSWVVDGDVVEDVLADVVDEAAKARSAPEAERKALLAGFRGRKAPGAERREDARTRQKDPKPFSSSRGRKRTREEGDERTAASPGLGFPEPKPLLESRPAVDATGDAERKKKGAERTGAAPLPVAATASSGSESSEGSETSASGESDSQTASGGEGDRASRSKRRREAVERAVAAAQRARLKEKAKDDAKDDFDDDSEVPFIDVDIVAPGGAVARALDTLPAAASRRKREPPRLEEFHAIRGLVRGSAADSLASPIRKPPPSSTVQFQLATPGNPFHVLAVRCDARSDEGDFDVRVGAGGLVYVDKKASADGEKGSTDVFELVARFPEPVDEASAQCVVKDGVLFVICEPSSE